MEQNTAADEEEREDAEEVNQTVQSLPIPDVYVYQKPGSDTTHVVSGTKYARKRVRGQDHAISMCGSIDIPVGPDDDLPEGVQHYADTLTPGDVMDDPTGVMALASLDLCGNCRASYGTDGVPEGVNVVIFDMQSDGGWER